MQGKETNYKWKYYGTLRGRNGARFARSKSSVKCVFILVIKGHSHKLDAHFLHLIAVPHKYEYNRREIGDKQELHDQ